MASSNRNNIDGPDEFGEEMQKRRHFDHLKFNHMEDPAYPPQKLDPSVLSDSLEDSIRRQVSEGNWD